jgi:hypothetical protein
MRYGRRAYGWARRHYRRPRLGALGKLITPLIGGVAFAEQITSADANRSAILQDPNTDMAFKAKYFINHIVGALTGFQPFSGAGEPTGQSFTFNPAGVLNKWVFAGIGCMILKRLPMVPFKSVIGKFGKGALIGGAVGGLFDPAPLQSVSYNPSMAAPQRTYTYTASMVNY